VSSRELAFRLEPFAPWSLAANRKDRAAKRRNGTPYRYTQRGHASAAKAVELATRAAVRRSGVSFPEGPVELEVILRSDRASRKYGDCGPAADLDGPLKGLLDALVSGGAMSDDVQIVRATITKTLGRPGLGVAIRSCQRKNILDDT
jgi:Holliday junction resolvase RusA-like endonuclease